jgi:site-specific recombinase XerD
MRRFFEQATDVIETDHPTAGEKLRRAGVHWMRQTHASHAPGRGTELTTVRDNLHHASIATTSICLQSNEVKRARQMNQAGAAR